MLGQRRSGILVVDDNAEWRTRICSEINSDDALCVWGEASSIKEAGSLLKKDKPALAQIDLGLPDGGGEAIITWLSQYAPNVESLVLTMFGDEHHVISAIQAGASGYLLKCDDPAQILTNIKLVLDGKSPISPAVARHILKSARRPVGTDAIPSAISSHSGTRQSVDKKSILTPTEIDVLNYIAKGFTGPEIANITGKSVNTVPVHIKNIYRKLSVSGRGEAVFHAIQLGLISANLDH
jgi:DNA-binding NarL/FixJ family response regulator